ncbi:uncharacterized protein LOC122811399 [Protopterus annectens]|uniref:uncharacterized protein LOC122811399 n=1 Tax=Protopterus annectens TaxID=7888 RepID=UPI001CFB452A|nr:uncharacterized protein LOC122811399 [Protopterus annectens]
MPFRSGSPASSIQSDPQPEPDLLQSEGLQQEIDDNFTITQEGNTLELYNYKIFNYSNIDVHPEHFQLFSKGFKFVPNRKASIPRSIIDLKLFLRKQNLHLLFNGQEMTTPSTPGLQRKSVFNPPLHPQLRNFGNLLERELRNTITKHFAIPNLSQAEKKLLNELKQNENLRVMHPDKGGGTVLMDNICYESKMRDSLHDTSKYSKASINEVNIAKSEIHLMLQDLLLDGSISKEQYNFLFNQHPRVPTVFGIPKVHKNPMDPPLRLIVSAEGSITTPLAKFVDDKLKVLSYTGDIVLKDSWDFLRCVKTHLYSPDLIFITLDIVDLFGSIPHETGLLWLEQAMIDNGTFSHVDFTNCLLFMEIILKNNYMYFQGEFFRQNKGVAMGAKCAPTYANIVLNWWEKLFILDCPFTQCWSMYKRFLDDICIFWIDTKERFYEFLDYLKGTTNFLDFTFEVNTEQLVYLDITLKKLDKGFSSSIHRKKTFSNSYLHYKSAHPYFQKKNLVKGQLVRVSRMTSDDQEFKGMQQRV